jgi:hypothetical protein
MGNPTSVGPSPPPSVMSAIVLEMSRINSEGARPVVHYGSLHPPSTMASLRMSAAGRAACDSNHRLPQRATERLSPRGRPGCPRGRVRRCLQHGGLLPHGCRRSERRAGGRRGTEFVSQSNASPDVESTHQQQYRVIAPCIFGLRSSPSQDCRPLEPDATPGFHGPKSSAPLGCGVT